MNNLLKYILPIIIVAVFLAISQKKRTKIFYGLLILFVIALVIGFRTIQFMEASNSIFSAPTYVYILMDTWVYIVGFILLMVFYFLKKKS